MDTHRIAPKQQHIRLTFQTAKIGALSFLVFGVGVDLFSRWASCKCSNSHRFSAHRFDPRKILIVSVVSLNFGTRFVMCPRTARLPRLFRKIGPVRISCDIEEGIDTVVACFLKTPFGKNCKIIRNSDRGFQFTDSASF